MSVNTTVGVNNSELENILVYPNPTSNFVNIKGLKSQLTRIELRDATGKLMLQKINPTKAINLQPYAKGVYLLTLFQDDVQKTIKIMKH